jgi:hypothetical protein
MFDSKKPYQYRMFEEDDLTFLKDECYLKGGLVGFVLGCVGTFIFLVLL